MEKNGQLNFMDLLDRQPTKDIVKTSDCEFWKDGKCHIFDTRVEVCTHCWLENKKIKRF